MRTTKTEVEAVFSRLCTTLGVPQGGVFDSTTRTMSRGWALDHNSAYGGWAIRAYDGKGTGQSEVGHTRMPAKQFVDAMHLMIQAEYARELLR